MCLAAPIPAHHVLCRTCYRENQETISQVQNKPLDARAVSQNLWGQRFEKNRTPANRTRIAYAAYLLAQEGEEGPLEAVRSSLTSGRFPEPDPAQAAPPTSATRPAKDPIKTPGGYRTKDGHYVRSKSERDIANFFFDNRIPYQYERILTLEGEQFLPDFYLPDHNLYVEHFGGNSDEYLARVKHKQDVYQRAEMRFVWTTEEDAADMEATLRRKLAQHVLQLRTAHVHARLDE